MNEFMNSNGALLLMAAALMCTILVISVLLFKMGKLQRSIKYRISEQEKRITAQQKQLVESVNTVLQITANGMQNSENRTQQLSDRMESRLDALVGENKKQLDEMRGLVENRLGETLDLRLGRSFEQVSKRLEEVHKGLGEMQALAGGVGDLKKVLQGVKTRGIWGEIQLSALLKDILTAGQYEENVAVVPDSPERVEFAVKLPGRDGNGLLLPIDSKLPLEPFNRLVDASAEGNRQAVEKAQAELKNAVLIQAKKISEKYIRTPYTTDFAIMFLPLESLYAEVIRLDAAEEIQKKYHVVITGPGTLSAVLNSLNLGFRTLNIEQRTGEVWQLLATLKTEFYRFGESLKKMRTRLDQASGELDSASARSKAITRKLTELDKYNEQ